MAWSIFRRASGDSLHHSWWQRAETIAASPSTEGVQALRSTMASPTDAPDEADRQAELVEGLERLMDLKASATLPEIQTQHRVIGPDRCHFIAPVSLSGPAAIAGKLFLTSNRAVFVGASVIAWPWHRVRSATREDRDVVLAILGGAEPFVVRCNTYADAFEAAFLAETLALAVRRKGSAT
jgi:hypothetical protein